MRVKAGILWIALSAAGVAAQTATLAVVNARVWTGDAAHPWAEAVAAAGERILAAGSNDEIRALAGPSARVVDGRGGLLTPGFIDSHIHLLAFDRNRPLTPIFMRFLAGREEVAARIRSYAAKLPPGGWILGEDWTDSTWRGPLPSRAWLDRLAPGHPVRLVQVEGAAGIANSAALRAAGITRQTPDEPPGVIERDRAGEPTGIVRGGPMWRVEAAITDRDRAHYEAALEKEMAALLHMGVTSVHHNNAWYDFLILRRMHEAGKLRVRVYASPGLPGWPRLRDYIAAHGRGDSWMHWGAVKGYGTITEKAYYRWVSGASQAGLQVMVHTGSNPELRILLSVFERVRREQNLQDPRFRVEHAHDMPPDAIPTMVRAGALASWQPPLLLHTDMRTAAGQPAPKNLFPCRALLQAGVKIAFGTDGGGENRTSPAASLALALERVAPDGSRITLDEALRAYTLDAAWAAGARTLYCEFENPKHYRDAVRRFRELQAAGDSAGSSIWVAPPRIFKPGEDWMLKQVRSCEADGYLVRNYDHLRFFATERKRGDFSLNVANPWTADFFLSRFGLERVTASYDLNVGQLEALLRAAPGR
ncbi:MAG: amidohydrolase family protein, partial [Acidobacteriia bacterium]|nr:amidohydrolase family protein [Terriglobia bacterium]